MDIVQLDGCGHFWSPENNLAD